MGPIVTVLQVPRVTASLTTFDPMTGSPERDAFSRRLHEVCDDLKLPAGHGRQAGLGRLFEVTPKGARKWLTGEGWPEMSMAMRIANKAGVNVLWLLQGTGPKRGERIDDSLRLVAEAIEHLPSAERGRVLHFLSFELAQHPGWFATEATARYAAAIDALAARPVLSAPPAQAEKAKAA